MLSNSDLAALFEEIADLMEILGEDKFRIGSYRKVARTLADLPAPAHELLLAGTLREQPGIGQSSADKINEALQTGKIHVLEELQAQVPPGLPALLRVPNLGPKKVAALWKELQVTNLEDLKGALDAGRVETLKGFGKKSADKIKAGLSFADVSLLRLPLGPAWLLSEQIVAYLFSLPGVRRVEPAGSLRRRKETIGDLDFLVEAADGQVVIASFLKMPGLVQTLAAGDTKGSGVFETGGQKVQVDVRVVPPESFGAALQYFTGSKEHNVRLRELAVKRGWKLNEYGLFDEHDRQIAGQDEDEIYAKLHLVPPPPELREDRGELALSAKPDLVELSDLRGDLHVHTDWSDGRATLEEMAAQAKRLGYEYLAICDHTQSSAIANGLDPKRMEQQIERIAAFNHTKPGVTVLAGAEVDIKADGRLDYPDSLLARLDFVAASVHSGLEGERKKMTHRVLAALENDYVCVLGHPTGRLINVRNPMDLDLPAIFRAAAEHGTALEINASWQRLDLNDVQARAARDAGCKFFINTDAHSTEGMTAMRYGVAMARRAGLTAADVLNTRHGSELKAWVASKRRRGVSKL